MSEQKDYQDGKRDGMQDGSIDDRRFIDLAGQGFAIEAEPFKPLADRLGISQQAVIDRLRGFIGDGRIRRFAASVRHQPMGFGYNAMVLVRTDKAHLASVGEAAAGLAAVSHCYQRNHPDGDPWCVYIMVHARDLTTLEGWIEKLRAVPGIRSLEICKSLVELKKTSVSRVTTTNLDGR